MKPETSDHGNPETDGVSALCSFRFWFLMVSEITAFWNKVKPDTGDHVNTNMGQMKTVTVVIKGETANQLILVCSEQQKLFCAHSASYFSSIEVW